MPSRKQRARQKLQNNSRPQVRGGRSSNFGYRLTGGYSAADEKRNVWDVAGYPQTVDFDMHWNLQARRHLLQRAR